MNESADVERVRGLLRGYVDAALKDGWKFGDHFVRCGGLLGCVVRDIDPEMDLFFLAKRRLGISEAQGREIMLGFQYAGRGFGRFGWAALGGDFARELLLDRSAP